MNNIIQLEQFPMMRKITEDIYLLSIPIPSGMVQVNCYLIRGKNGYTIIDTGSPAEEGKEIWDKILATGITIEKIVLTHYHIDHLGLAGWFKEKYQIPVFISEIGYREMQKRRDKDFDVFVNNLFKQHGLPDTYLRATDHFAPYYQFEPDGKFNIGEPILLGDEEYEPIWTPGHSADQFCFYNKKHEIMVVGDHILEKLSPVILIESQSDINPLLDYFQSLEKVENFSVKIALTGHGNTMQGLNDRIEEIRMGHYHRMDQILASLKEEAKTAWQLSLETYDIKNMGKYFSPVMATITRCIYLESVGKLRSKVVDGNIYYYAY